MFGGCPFPINVHGGISHSLAKSKLTLLEINEIVRQNIGVSADEIMNENENTKLVFGLNGPLWYRGYFRDQKKVKRQLRKIFSHFGGNKIIIGHTSTNDISKMFDGEICAIDVIQPEKSTDRRNAKALLKENNRYYKIDDNGTKILL